MLYKWSNNEHVYVDRKYHPWSTGKVMLSHDLRLDVGSNFIYVTKAILILNVGCKCFIIAN
jgi:hypothetical protein